MDDLGRVLSEILRRLGELERRIRSQSRTGVVVKVDAKRGLARVQLNDGPHPFVTGWLPWEEGAAGEAKTHLPPSVGQQVKVYSESGDLHDGTIQASINSNANGRPSGAGDEFVLMKVGDALISVRGGGSEIVLKVGASSVVLTAGGVVVDGPRIDLAP